MSNRKYRHHCAAGSAGDSHYDSGRWGFHLQKAPKVLTNGFIQYVISRAVNYMCLVQKRN